MVNTPLSLFNMKDLSFGLARAPAIFQHLIEHVIGGILGCVNCLDYKIVTRKTEEEHLKNLGYMFHK